MSNRTTRTKNYSYETLRARLVERGHTLRAFALEKRYPLQTVYSAAKRQRHGVKSKRIRRELEALAA
jgi:hypothetical protein